MAISLFQYRPEGHSGQQSSAGGSDPPSRPESRAHHSGPRSYDGRCTRLRLRYYETELEAANSTIGSHAEAYSAMKYAGLKRECGDLARKSGELLLKEWRLHGHIHEDYSGDTGMGCDKDNSDPCYHWGGLLAYIAIDHDQQINDKS